MEQKDNLFEVIKTLLKWRKQLIVVGGLAALGSSIVALALPNYFQATTVFLAVSPDQAMPELIFNSGPVRAAYYGNENDIDRLLTIAESTELIDFLVDTFNLYQHYDVNQDHPKARHHIRLAFLELYQVGKTKRDAIELSVEDKDRELAMQIANSARNKIDELARNLIRKNMLKTLQTYDYAMKNQEEEVQMLSDSLEKVRRQFGIFNVMAQSEFLTTQLLETEAKLAQQRGRLKILDDRKNRVPRDTILYLQATVNGLEQSMDTIQKRIELLNTGLSKVTTFEKMYLQSNQVLTDNMERFKKWKDTYDSEIPAIILVEEAILPSVKSRPRRSIIVLASISISLLFGVIAILLIDTYKDLRWRELFS